MKIFRRPGLPLAVFCLCLGGCVWPIIPHPGSEREASEQAEYARRQADEEEKLSQKYVGWEKGELLKTCGEPDKKHDRPVYKDAAYDESWEYVGGCGRGLAIDYRIERFYFINYRVAEVGLF